MTALNPANALLQRTALPYKPFTDEALRRHARARACAWCTSAAAGLRLRRLQLRGSCDERPRHVCVRRGQRPQQRDARAAQQARLRARLLLPDEPLVLPLRLHDRLLPGAPRLARVL